MSTSIIRLRLTKSTLPGGGSVLCPHCRSASLVRWRKAITTSGQEHCLLDWPNYYRCYHCSRSFFSTANLPSHPDNVLQRIAGLAWALGLSYGEIRELFKSLDLDPSRESLWAEGRQLLAQLREHRRSRLVDISVEDPWEDSGTADAFISIELEQGRAVFLRLLYNQDPLAIRSWLGPIIQELELEAELLEYRLAR